MAWKVLSKVSRGDKIEMHKSGIKPRKCKLIIVLNPTGSL